MCPPARLDAVLITHSDNDHYSVPTCRDLAGVAGEYHSTEYVASLMQQRLTGPWSRHRRSATVISVNEIEVLTVTETEALPVLGAIGLFINVGTRASFSNLVVTST
jgi:hypothetical protein